MPTVDRAIILLSVLLVSLSVIIPLFDYGLVSITEIIIALSEQTVSADWLNPYTRQLSDLVYQYSFLIVLINAKRLGTESNHLISHLV